MDSSSMWRQSSFPIPRSPSPLPPILPALQSPETEWDGDEGVIGESAGLSSLEVSLELELEQPSSVPDSPTMDKRGYVHCF